MDVLHKEVSGEPKDDREYINKISTIVFTNSYLEKQIASGKGREKILTDLRDTKRYATINGMFHELYIIVLL